MRNIEGIISEPLELQKEAFYKMWNIINHGYADHQSKYLTGSTKETNYCMIFI